ncbi:Uncharacterized protein BM_BM7662 [Brugia malayi]|uniref:ShKT domain-containing protein n=2 Tax=Brugia TaxID=6278 RepID=A0A4E9FDZ5_BRUMA|nr:Uncharacterized protein BM_BM7662 [Brugia malayi]VIO94672.1 Uncharacterized protein BM_BM7662 [Brugia malayi]
MKKQISITVITIFLLFAISSAQQESKQPDDSLLISEIRSNRAYRQAILHQKDNVIKLPNHKVTTAHYVNLSKSMAEVPSSDAVVKVYGEANPSKTDEELLDVETNTQIVYDSDHTSSMPSSDQSIHHLSISGYGAPAEETETAETDQQAEVITEMKASMPPAIEDPYGGGGSGADGNAVLTEAEQQAITAENPSTTSREEGSSSITNTEQAIIPNKESTNITESEETFRESGESATESSMSDAKVTESVKKACAEDCEVSTEGSVGIDKGSTEAIVELSQTSSGSQEDSIVSSTGDSIEGYRGSSKQFESKSNGTEAVGMSTSESEKTESAPEGYGAVPETVRSEVPLKTEVESISSGSIEITLSESTMESSTYNNITHTQTKAVDMQTEAEDFGYGVISETIKEQSSQENQESVTRIETATHQSLDQTTALETEMSSNQSDLATNSAEVTSELFTSPITSSTTADTSYIITEGTAIAKVESSPVIESTESISGYEIHNEPQDTVTVIKVDLPGLNKESASHLSKSIEEATALSSTSMETGMASEKATIVLAGTVSKGPEDLKDSTESSIRVNETTGFFREATLTSTEKLPEYSTVASEYITDSTYQKKETIELQKTSEKIKVSSSAPYDVEKIPGDLLTTSDGAVVTSEASEYQTATKLEGLMAVEETTEISKSDEGLVGYGDIGESEQVSSKGSQEGSGIIATETLEGTTKRSELLDEEISTNDATTTFIEQPKAISNEMVIPDEATGSQEQPIGYEGLALTADTGRSEEAQLNQTITNEEQATGYELSVSSQSVATSEVDITTDKVVAVTESTSTAQSERAIIRTSPEDFGYGGAVEEGITEREHVGSNIAVNSASTISIEETMENSNLSQQYSELSGSAEASKSSEGEAVYLKSTSMAEQSASGEATTASKSIGSAPGYDVSVSDYYPTTEEIINELSGSDEKLTEQQEIAEITSSLKPETSERISVVNEETRNFVSITESAADGYRVSAEEKFTETPISETISIQAESNKISTDADDFGYGGRLEEVTEAETLVTTAESIVTTQGMQFTDETKSETIQQPSAIETSSMERTTKLETSSAIESTEISSQYPVADRGDTMTSLEKNNEIIETDKFSEIVESTVPSQAAKMESTLMDVITNEEETPIPYGISEEALKLITMTKKTETGLSKLTGATVAVTEEAKEESEMTDTETTKESHLAIESVKSEKTLGEVRNEMDSMSSETTSENTASEFYEAKIPMGPEDFGYGSEKELSTELISSSAESVTTIRSELSSNADQTSIAPELSVSNEYANFGMSKAPEYESSEKLLSATVPSVTSNALTESFTIIQKESVTREDERSMPTTKVSGNDDNKTELSNAVSTSTAISEEKKQDDHSDVPNAVLSSIQSKQTGNSAKRKWRPFTINCDTEVDEKGDLCREWAKADLCDTHRPTMFLFCRRTCLCIGPPTDAPI